ncbi:uncharacterized protein LOC117175498 [Belonocnema kinseyi]|uniref:uncharacterized protein LOC117175498 n=1 Tax=Belonocnema kinseyi TaxID=2817044 RepID=UPI00143DECD4|nr:uncharacterized protein LOC117175498 [Belonocnema kinseyi]
MRDHIAPNHIATSSLSENINGCPEYLEDRTRPAPQENVVIQSLNQLDVQKLKETYEFPRREQCRGKNATSSGVSKACGECEDYSSLQKDDGNLSKCYQDKMKRRNLGNGHSSNSGRRSRQESIYDNVEKNTDKFSSSGSKMGQCTSSPCSEYRHQDQRERSRKFQTTSELRRSTPKPASLEKDELSYCFYCCNKANNIRTEQDLSKFNQKCSNVYSEGFVGGKFNPNDCLKEKGENNFCVTFNLSSSDSLNNNVDNVCEEENLEIDQLNKSPRVLCLEELNDRIVEALNEMFVSICPFDIACIPSYCTYETCKSTIVDDFIQKGDYIL